MLYWHYTTLDRLFHIIQDGSIHVATAGVEACEKPAVWFSANQHWEHTAAKTNLLRDAAFTFTEMIALGIARIGVTGETARYDWKAFQMMSGIRPEVACGLAKAGKLVGANPRQWRVSFEPVSRDRWQTIEVFRQGRWMPINSVAAWQPFLQAHLSGHPALGELAA